MRAPNNAYPRATLREWRLKRFKSVADARVRFSPLTVVVGANSSGKSTLIQSILLAVQAAQAGESTDTFPLNGPLVSLGTFDDVRCRTCGRRGAIELGGTIQVAPGYRLDSTEWQAEGTLSRQGRMWRRPFSQKPETVRRPYLGRVTWSVAFREAAAKETGAAEVGSARAEWSYDQDEGRREALKFRSGARGRQITVDAETQLHPLLKGTVTGPDGQTEEVFDPRFLGGVPVGFLVEEDENVLLVYQWARTAVLAPAQGVSRARLSQSRLNMAASERSDRPEQEALDRAVIEGAHCAKTEFDKAKAAGTEEWQSEFLRSARRVSRAPWAMRIRESRSIEDLVLETVGLIGSGEATLVEGGELAEQLAYACRRAASFLATGVSYLGPLREDPHPIYQRAPFYGSSALGPKGEYTAAAILAHADDPVVCPMPHESAVRHLTLKKALEYWLQYFEVAQKLEALPSPLGPVLRVAETPQSKGQDLINVGVGVSQLLPVLAACILARPGSLVLLEQPELHLHPALQLKLGDFLLATALSGRQLIVETHSEHIIARLRAHVVGAPSDELVDWVSILFAERREGRTEYTKVRPNAYGGLDSWPAGFFDQSAKETQLILRRAVEKRRIESEM